MKATSIGSNNFGAYIEAFDAKSCTPESISTLKKYLSEYKFISILDQDITLHEYETLAKYFGEPLDQIFVDHLPNHPHIIEVSRVPNETSVLFGQTWHSDFTFLPKPPTFTLLYGRIIPESGGNTLFCDQVRAYELLPRDLQLYIQTHTSSHQAAAFSTGGARSSVEFENQSSMKFKHLMQSFDQKYFEPHSHPMIYEDQQTSRTAIYVNSYSKRIDNVSAEESTRVMNEILKYQLHEENLVSLKWYPNMITIWDNRLVMHKATLDYNANRKLYRMVVREKTN